MDPYETTEERILEVLSRVEDVVVKFYRLFRVLNQTGATALTLNVSGDNQVATATVQFVDVNGLATAGPNDSVTGSPIIPVVVSDTTSVLTVATGVAGTVPGQSTYALTDVSDGTANLSVSPIENSDGSPALDSAGNPFTLPVPVPVVVAGGSAVGLTLTVA